MKTKVMLLLLALTFSVSAGAQKLLSLHETIAAALDSNRQLRIQELALQRADNKIKEERSYSLPEIKAGAGMDYYLSRQVIFLLEGDKSNPSLKEMAVGGRNVLMGNVSVTQPLLNLSHAKQVQVARVGRDIERVRLTAKKNDLQLAIARQYLTIALYNRQLVVLDQSLKRTEKATTDAKSLFAQGRSVRSDTLNADISVLNVRAAIAALKSEIDIAKLQLNELVGFDITTGRQLSDSLYAGEIGFDTTSLSGMIAVMNTGNPELQIERLRVLLSQKEEEYNRTLNKPQLIAAGQHLIQAQSDALSLGSLSWPQTNFVGLRFVVPIYAGGRQSIRNKSMKLVTEERSLQLEEKVNALKTKLTDAILKLKNARTQLDIADQTIAAARLTYNTTVDRYKNGAGTRLELNEAEFNLTKAQLNSSVAAFDVRIHEFELMNLAGKEMK